MYRTRNETEYFSSGYNSMFDGILKFWGERFLRFISAERKIEAVNIGFIFS